MKFQDKLSKIRKEKNLSQEALAEKMGMSRQAISKWESGSSYPDMSTIIRLTKVLDCKLEDLIDDNAIGIKKENTKININDILKDVLSFITKTYNMFWSMKFIEKIKCLIELLLIILMCYFASYIFGIFLKDTLLNIFKFLPDKAYIYIIDIFKMLYSILMFIVSFVVTIHLFKIRYLDYYITIEDKSVTDKTIEKDESEKKKVYVNNKHEKIIIRDPVHSTNKFMDILLKLIKNIIKLFVTFILIFLIISFIFLAFSTTVSLIWFKYGILFLGINILSIGLLLCNYIFIELFIKFIFDKTNSFKRLFIMFIISLFTIGIGFGTIFLELSNFKYNYNNKYDLETTLNINYKDNMIIEDLEYYYKRNLVTIDNNIKDIEIDIEYSKYIEPIIKNNDNYYFIDYISKDYNVFKYVLNDIKNKEINFDNYYDYNIKSIKMSKTNYDNLIKNSNEME